MGDQHPSSWTFFQISPQLFHRIIHRRMHEKEVIFGNPAFSQEGWGLVSPDVSGIQSFGKYGLLMQLEHFQATFLDKDHGGQVDACFHIFPFIQNLRIWSGIWHPNRDRGWAADRNAGRLHGICPRFSSGCRNCYRKPLPIPNSKFRIEHASCGTFVQRDDGAHARAAAASGRGHGERDGRV